ncbi:MAG: ABC transporter permease subunit [Geminicoccaceae bacterium]
MPVIVLNAFNAIRHTPKSLIEMGKAFIGSRLQPVTSIILPSASPVIFAGLRLGAAAAFIGAILAELLITPIGIGDIITYNQSIADYPKMYAAIASIIVFSMLFIEFSGMDRRAPLPPRATRSPRQCGPGQLDLSKSRRGANGMSLDIPDGQLTTLLGPSGNTPQDHRMLDRANSGARSGWNGKAVTGFERAFVFPDFAPMPWGDGHAGRCVGLELKGVVKAEREAIAERYILDVGLKGFERAFPQ